MRQRAGRRQQNWRESRRSERATGRSWRRRAVVPVEAQKQSTHSNKETRASTAKTWFRKGDGRGAARAIALLGQHGEQAEQRQSIHKVGTASSGQNSTQSKQIIPKQNKTPRMGARENCRTHSRKVGG